MDGWLIAIERFNLLNAIDIIIVAYLLYRLLLLIRGTRAVQLLQGIIFILMATALSSLLHLTTVNWLLNKILTLGFFAIPIVFQPELRRALEQVGRGGFFSLSFRSTAPEETQQLIAEIVKSTQVLSKAKIGALIVIERETGLTEYIETGTLVEGLVSSQLLINTFIPNTPLHDGAVVVRGRRLVSAGCFLPLTENRNLDKELGTRHRAALGVTEQSDAVAVVVSEETGKISIAVDGVLTRDLSENALFELLTTLLTPRRTRRLHLLGRKAES
ncbi:diadenylate cyclase CdaA [Alicyclobacillus mengziensis]|uniref:Diadenylate cyclase n=1 Tax=Alicyclobacillus mengziensis TaxID=2931921 RepID=A0A9X7W0N1_9BACL|nr:diadenylate cyclase CdaA [Alicyclobacillus mengziensis]QSO48030.1 diadenylate cyclase CdaA [Alicyclobacillus mengziensis]